MKKQRVGGGPDQPGDRPSKKKFFTEHPEKKNIEPAPRGPYPDGTVTTREHRGYSVVQNLKCQTKHDAKHNPAPQRQALKDRAKATYQN
jgi:hypothetical protein